MSRALGASLFAAVLMCGVHLDLAHASDEVIGPPARPSLDRARRLYASACQHCHGDRGVAPPHGAPAGARLPSFADPDWLDEQTPADVFDTIRSGHGDRLQDKAEVRGLQEAWDVATLLWSFGRTRTQIDDGRRLFALHCADCHGAAGDGIGAVVEERPATSSDFSLVGSLATESDDDLAAELTDGLPEFGMPGFATTLNDSQRRNLIWFLRALPFTEVYLATAAGREASFRSQRLSRPDAAAAARRLDRTRRRILLQRSGWLIVVLGAIGAAWWWGRRGRP